MHQRVTRSGVIDVQSCVDAVSNAPKKGVDLAASMNKAQRRRGVDDMEWTRLLWNAPKGKIQSFCSLEADWLHGGKGGTAQ